MGDVELLLRLADSESVVCKALAIALKQRKLFKPVFIADALGNVERNIDSYREMQDRMTEMGVATPEGRREVEQKLARRVGLDESQVIIYWPRDAPGLQKVQDYIQKQPGEAPLRRGASSNDRMVWRHLALWSVYVFAHPDIDERASKSLGTAAQGLFGLENLFSLDRRRGLLS